MSLKIKIQNGTPQIGKNLCLDCKHAHIVKGFNGEVAIRCSDVFFRSGPGPVPFQVAECTEFKSRTTPSKGEMEAIAWQITPRKRGPKGFQQAAEGEKTEMEVVIKPPKKDRSEQPE